MGPRQLHGLDRWIDRWMERVVLFKQKLPSTNRNAAREALSVLESWYRISNRF